MGTSVVQLQSRSLWALFLAPALLLYSACCCTPRSAAPITRDTRRESSPLSTRYVGSAPSSRSFQTIELTLGRSGDAIVLSSTDYGISNGGVAQSHQSGKWRREASYLVVTVRSEVGRSVVYVARAGPGRSELEWRRRGFDESDVAGRSASELFAGRERSGSITLTKK